MGRSVRIAAAVLVLAAACAALAGPAAAAPAKHPLPAGPLPNALPPRYVIVNSGTLSAPDGSQSHGSVACPAKTVPTGGGVYISSLSTAANVNSSYPLPDGWNGDVNNTSGSATTFLVYAICVKRNAFWTIVAEPFTNTANHQDSAIARCPAGTKVLGGGGFSSSSSTGSVESRAVPFKAGTSSGYDVVMNNDDSFDHAATAYAVCGHSAGWQLIRGAAVTAPPGSQTLAAVSCPSPKVPLGGGLDTTATGTLGLDLDTSYPALGGGWSGYENNRTAVPASILAIVICAGK